MTPHPTPKNLNLNQTMKTSLTHNEACIETCNSLLRGELSAIETYTKAIKRFADNHELAVLHEIRSEHEQTVSELQQNVLGMGGTPSTESGIWGDFAAGVQSAANLFGEDSAIASLIQGEKHGIREYEEAIDDDDTLPECRDLMVGTWLPRLRSHIDRLERMS